MSNAGLDMGAATHPYREHRRRAPWASLVRPFNTDHSNKIGRAGHHVRDPDLTICRERFRTRCRLLCPFHN
jgi:hypothetical protein